ncbi:MAG: V-type ATP synthase subunit F [Treponema sp.]|nr:V-type ATP synthase subunit F [Treponema sp.]
MDYFFLGDEELVTAFKFIGINGIAVKDANEAAAEFKKITEAAECRILLLTEETADWLGSDMTDWQLSGNYPLLVEIPGISGRLTGRKTLVEAIREAIGIRV